MDRVYYKLHSFFRVLPLFLGMFFLSTSAMAQCVITGADLPSYPGATFPTTTPTTTGTSLVFGAGGSDEIIMTVPMIPSGTLLPTSDFNVNLRMYMTRISSDNDPVMGISDGNATDFSGTIANDGSSHFDVNGILVGNSVTLAYTTVGSCNGSCGTAVGDSYSVDMTFDVTSGVTSSTFTSVQGINSSTSTVPTYPQTYDPSTGVNFVLIRQSAGETYQVDSVVIVCATAPIINSISPDAIVCEGADTLLSVSASGGSSTSYQWQLAGVDVPGATNDTLVFSPTGSADAGLYTCIVSNVFGSDTSAVVNFGVNSVPSASIVGPSAVCIGDSVTLMGNATGGTPAYTYDWNPIGSTIQNPTVSPISDTIYTLMVIDSNGCTSNLDSLVMTVNSVPTVSIMADTSICPGGSAILVATAADGTAPYIYSWNPGALNTATVTVNPTTTTTYTVSVSDSNSCSVTESATVIVYAGPTSAYSYTGTGVDSVSFVSTSTGATSWSWDFGDGNTSTLENPDHVYTSAGSYIACLTTTGVNGCTNTVCETILIGSAGLISNEPFDLNMYPNPADQFVNLIIENETKLIQITDINGRIVYENVHPIENNIQIPLERWSNGIYIIHLTDAQNGVNSGRLSVSH